jgi:RNaseH domain of pPIWI_RE
VLESLLADGTETVVMADAATIRKEVSAFSNQDMCLGDLQLQGLPGATPLHILDGASNLSVIRLTAELSKPASYSRVNAKNFTVGTFQEPGRTRTYWAVRQPPLSMDLNPKWKHAMRSPRRPMSPDARDFSEVDPDLIGADRLAPVLEELVIMVRSAQMDFDMLAGFVRKLRPAHVSWSGETVLPYPLHEASRLERHLK